MGHSFEHSNVEPNWRPINEGGGSSENLFLYNEKIDELWKAYLHSGPSLSGLGKYYNQVRELRKALNIGDPDQGEAYVPRERMALEAQNASHGISVIGSDPAVITIGDSGKLEETDN